MAAEIIYVSCICSLTDNLCSHVKERLIKWVRCGIRCFYVAVIKYHDLKQLKEEFILAYRCGELDVDGENILWQALKDCRRTKNRNFTFMLAILLVSSSAL